MVLLGEKCRLTNIIDEWRTMQWSVVNQKPMRRISFATIDFPQAIVTERRCWKDHNQSPGEHR